MDEQRIPWWRSQKVMVLLILVSVVTAALVAVVVTGHLPLTEGLVRDYLYAVAGLGGTTILGRGLEGMKAKP